MAKKFIIVNIGSTSKKYALWSEASELANFRMSNESPGYSSSFTIQKGNSSPPINEEEYNMGILFFVKLLEKENLISKSESPTAIAIRVVAPGDFFTEHKEIDNNYIDELNNVFESAPLHIEGTLDEILKIKKNMPGSLLYGISDSHFHTSMNIYAKSYALPRDIRELVPRYGYHGISLQSCLRSIKKELGTVPSKVIICHLGGGASVTAIKDSMSTDTSMGFSPLSGIPMATRSGTIDSGAIVEIMKKKKMSIEDLENLLNKESGLLGLSGSSGDVRKLLKLDSEGDEGANFALGYYTYSIKKIIGSYIATLGGLDLLVFTGAIGVGSSVIREKVLKGTEYLGLELDSEKNLQSLPQTSFINTNRSGSKIATIPVSEMREMFVTLNNLI